MNRWTLRFEVAFDVPPTVVPGASDWTLLTRRVNPRVRMSSGFGFGGGRATVTLDNRDRQFDPTNPESPHNLVPMRHARLTVDVNGTIHPLFRGFVQRWQPSWPAPTVETVRVELVTADVLLAMYDGYIELPRQSTGERIGQLLDLAGWPAGLRTVANGVVTVEPVEVETGNVLRLLEDTADAEDGHLLVDPDGVIRFESRHARFDGAPSVQVGAVGVAYTQATPRFDADDIINISRTVLADGGVFEASDLASVAAFGPRVHPVRDLPLLGVEAAAIAEWVVHRYADPFPTVEQITLDAGAPGAMSPMVDARVGQLVEFTRTSSVGVPFTELLTVEQITHQMGPGRWTSTWSTSPYFGDGPWFEVDASQLDSDDKLAP